MGVEDAPVRPVLCGSCDISRLEQESQPLALEVGRAIMEDEASRRRYGTVLLALTVKGALNMDQSQALIGCLKNNVNGKCHGLERPQGIYAVQ